LKRDHTREREDFTQGAQRKRRTQRREKMEEGIVVRNLSLNFKIRLLTKTPIPSL
jgi:hypothetical protein